MHNSGQSYFDQFINYTYTKIEIIPVMDTDLLRHQCDIVVQSAKRSLERFFGVKMSALDILFYQTIKI